MWSHWLTNLYSKTCLCCVFSILTLLSETNRRVSKFTRQPNWNGRPGKIPRFLESFDRPAFEVDCVAAYSHPIGGRSIG
jgi:hypothetical protein